MPQGEVLLHVQGATRSSTTSSRCHKKKHHHEFKMPISLFLDSLPWKCTGNLRKDLCLFWLMSVLDNVKKSHGSQTSAMLKCLNRWHFWWICLYFCESKQCDLLWFGRFVVCYSHRFWLTQLICETNSKLADILVSNLAIHYSSLFKKASTSSLEAERKSHHRAQTTSVMNCQRRD